VSDAVRFGYADTVLGQVHYAEAGAGEPLLCLHQTPRSWDEYRELLPLLAGQHRVVAMDTLGMGASAPPQGVASIEAYAAGAAALVDALDLGPVAVMGHHTGGVIALELAASRPELVRRLVLSSTPWVDAASRQRRAGRPPIDQVEVADDGSHLVELWRRRQAFYPPGRPDILERFVRDALAARDPEEGHLAVGRYRMEDRVGLVTAPTLSIGASGDPHAFPDHPRLAAALVDVTTAVIDGGTVALLEERADDVAPLVLDFLRAR